MLPICYLNGRCTPLAAQVRLESEGRMGVGTGKCYYRKRIIPVMAVASISSQAQWSLENLWSVPVRSQLRYGTGTVEVLRPILLPRL